jgi:hypothetical protein
VNAKTGGPRGGGGGSGKSEGTREKTGEAVQSGLFPEFCCWCCRYRCQNCPCADGGRSSRTASRHIAAASTSATRCRPTRVNECCSTLFDCMLLLLLLRHVPICRWQMPLPNTLHRHSCSVWTHRQQQNSIPAQPKTPPATTKCQRSTAAAPRRQRLARPAAAQRLGPALAQCSRLKLSKAGHAYLKCHLRLQTQTREARHRQLFLPWLQNSCSGPDRRADNCCCQRTLTQQQQQMGS